VCDPPPEPVSRDVPNYFRPTKARSRARLNLRTMARYQIPYTVRMVLLDHDLSIAKPDYRGGSIVNLMRSLGDVCGARPSAYAPLPGVADRLRDADRIVLLILDGVGAQLLQSIGRETSFAAHQTATITSVYPPTTATAITTFLTGLAPQQHGLTGWFMHFRRLGAVTAVLPFVPRYSVEPLSAYGIEIGSLIDCPSFFDAIDGPSIALLPKVISDSDFSRLLGGRASRLPYRSLDEFAAILKRCCEGGEAARFIYAYWSDFDRLSHMHGPSAKIVAEHLGELDRALAPVMEVCARNGTALVATADHGFIDSGVDERIDMADHPELADMLSLPLCGEPRSAYCYVRPNCTGTFEQYIGSELADYIHLVRSEQLLEEGWFGIGEPHPEFTARIGDYTLQMRGRYTIRDSVEGERQMSMAGMHGGVSAAELYVPLIVAGP
jgi:hypothetical protein